VPAYVIKYLEGAMDDYQHGVMAGMNDNVERLSGQKPMSVGKFARALLDQLTPLVSKYQKPAELLLSYKLQTRVFRRK